LGEVEAEESAPTSPAGSLLRVPGHDVVEEIARGGMGIVYRARQLEPPRTVALKMLPPHQLRSPEMRARFRFEARAGAALDHPAILPVYRVGEQDGLPYFTMKFATGGTLAERMTRFTGQWRAITRLVATVADAVHFAHEHGVLHRDLKPGNILFDEADQPYVSDFGLARLVGEDSSPTRALVLLGTPHYLAPEVAAGSVHGCLVASDVYSLGSVLYELLAGQPPFTAETLNELLRKIAEEAPAAPSVIRRTRLAGTPTGDSATEPVPRELEAICLKCLAKEPARRYGSADALAVALRLWLSSRLTS
jgi:serine/threonine-protein kinase